MTSGALEMSTSMLLSLRWFCLSSDETLSTVGVAEVDGIGFFLLSAALSMPPVRFCGCADDAPKEDLMRPRALTEISK